MLPWENQERGGFNLTKDTAPTKRVWSPLLSGTLSIASTSLSVKFKAIVEGP